MNGKWEPAGEVRYVYDGRLVVQERDGNNLPLVSYTRGSDVSGSFQGAAGIGGLLARTDHSTMNPTHAFYHADGNGNVTSLINDKQLVVARYEYDPFGNILSKSEPLADGNLYRFSSQEYHQNSGLLLYLYRAYDPNLQRFINRDPIEELGGINLYGFVGNNALGRVDLWGLDDDEGDELDKAVERALKCGEKTNYVTHDQSHEASEKALEIGLAVPKSLAEACMMMCPVGAAGKLGKGLKTAENVAADAAKIKKAKDCVTQGKAVLGRFPAYLKKAKELDADVFNIPKARWDRMTKKAQWAANRKFLDQVIARGDRVVLASPLSEAKAGTTFRREIDYMLSHGYHIGRGGRVLVPD